MLVWARRRVWMTAAGAAVVALLLGAGAIAWGSLFGSSGEIGPNFHMTANGRLLSPAGRMTTVGDFPTGGTLTPDGRFYWVVDSGHGQDAAEIMEVGSGKVVQKLALPGAYGGIAFSPDGTHAYISGEPRGSTPPLGATKGDDGDVIHIFQVDRATGQATESDPITLPKLPPGNSQSASTNRDWPEGLAVSPDGATLVVALNQADAAAIIDLGTNAIKTVKVGQFPSWVAIDPQGAFAYMTNEYDGTVSKIDLKAGTVAKTIGVGGPGPNPDGRTDPNVNAHPESLTIDRSGAHVYVPVAHRDQIATIDTADDSVSYISVKRGDRLGAEPVAVALSSDGQRLYAANENEDDIAVVDLRQRRMIGRVPTASFPTAVAVTASRQLVWVAGKGFGSGPNPAYANGKPLGSYVLDMLYGRVGVLPEPQGANLASFTQVAERQMVPANAEVAPADTPLRPDGPIKHVFYIIKENRTYDQIFGSLGAHGDGDPSLELFDDNGVSGPAGGVTPNAHALTRQFPLLTHMYADSDVSQDGHQITDAAFASDMVERNQHANYSGRGRQISNDNAPVAAPPRYYIFDQAARQGISFRNYGEYGAKTVIDDGRPTFAQSFANYDHAYPAGWGCSKTPISPANCWTDSGTIGTGAEQTDPHSRLDYFENQLKAQIETSSVPALNVLIMPNDHTQGTTPGLPTPKAEVADNDLAIGQFVEVLSHSSIWKSSAVFIVEDDTQDGADHIDSHRMPAYAISPYVKHGAVIRTRYDHASVLRSMELILGLKPLGLNDAVATPMYDVFTSHPDLSTYTAIKPEYSLTTPNPATAAAARLSAAMPWSAPDAVPQSIADRILWQSVYGARSTPPRPGPNASEDEEARARIALSTYRAHGNVGKALARTGTVLEAQP
jgi:DNA-binding beta-propeller fold protein YncE